MPDSPSGVYSLPSGYKVTNGDTSDASQHNPPLEDIAAALTERICRDGRTSWTGNQNANGKKLTNLGAATDPGDALSLGGLGAAVAASEEKTDPVDGDLYLISDSEDSGKTKVVKQSTLIELAVDAVLSDAVGTTAGTLAAGDDSRIAGAVQKTATSTSDFGFVVDEDDMSSNSATKVPTQQSVKAYVDGSTAGRAKAWGKFNSSGLLRGYNIASVSGSGAVTFVNSMPNSNYTILATNTGTSDDSRYANIRSQTSSGFQVLAGTSVLTMHVVVFD